MVYDAASSPSHSNSFSDDHYSAPAPAHAAFNANATVPERIFPDIRAHLQAAAQLLTLAGSDLSLTQLEQMREEIKEMVNVTRAHTAEKLFVSIKDRIAPLGIKGAETFGRDFVSAFESSNISMRVDPTLLCSAAYCSYTFKEDRRGFVNEVAINPERVDVIDQFTTSTAHEIFHGLQKSVSLALRHSPFNPDTRAVVHPADWILLEQLCEQDAFTKEGFLTKLLADANPETRKHSTLISIDEVESHIRSQPTLADAMVSMALGSMCRPHDKAHPRGRTYADHYVDVAIKNYSAGMWNRKHEGQNDLTFVRLELRDLWQVGNYGVGPNSFGENVMEPLIQRRPRMSEAAQKNFDQMCKDYEIPPISKCQTLTEYREGRSAPVSQQRSAPSRQQTAAPVYAHASI